MGSDWMPAEAERDVFERFQHADSRAIAVRGSRPLFGTANLSVTEKPASRMYEELRESP